MRMSHTEVQAIIPRAGFLPGEFLHVSSLSFSVIILSCLLPFLWTDRPRLRNALQGFLDFPKRNDTYGIIIARMTDKKIGTFSFRS